MCSFWRFAGKRNADGALHRAAGPQLLEACARIPSIGSSNSRCHIGEAITTPAFGELHAALVVHAVAPDGLYAAGLQQWWGRRQWSGSQSARAVHLDEAKPAGEANALLHDTFSAILEAAHAAAVRSVGMPAIGCGVLGFPSGRAAKVALGAFAAHADGGSGSSVERIDVALFDDDAFTAWSRVARALLGEPARKVQAAEVAGAEVYDLRRMREGES